MPREFFDNQDGRWWSLTSLRGDFRNFAQVSAILGLLSIKTTSHDGETYYHVDDIRAAKQAIERNERNSTDKE